jgi:hypothetical protein
MYWDSFRFVDREVLPLVDGELTRMHMGGERQFFTPLEEVR